MAKKFRDMVKLRSNSDVGDGNVIKELHRTIQFSDRALPGGKPVVDEEKFWRGLRMNPKTGL